MYQVSVRVKRTIYPGTGYQDGSTEWLNGIVEANSQDDAVEKAKAHIMAKSTDKLHIEILETKVEAAKTKDTSFFVDFILPKTTEIQLTDREYLGYLEYYVRVFFDDGDACAAYACDFAVPDNVRAQMDDFIELCKSFYATKMNRTVTRVEFITRDEYQASMSSSSIALEIDAKEGKITDVSGDIAQEIQDEIHGPDTPRCTAPCEMGCGLWDNGKIIPGTCDQGCLRYFDPKKAGDDT